MSFNKPGGKIFVKKHGCLSICYNIGYRYEHIRGFYRGLTPYMVHVTPNICLVFLIYETCTGER